MAWRVWFLNFWKAKLSLVRLVVVKCIVAATSSIALRGRPLCTWTERVSDVILGVPTCRAVARLSLILYTSPQYVLIMYIAPVCALAPGLRIVSSGDRVRVSLSSFISSPTLKETLTPRPSPLAQDVEDLYKLNGVYYTWKSLLANARV
ncbi:hypothetical protein BDK51DRAFT_49866 [Blyttiomyces helicus]|uniref:Uncharacterized protein n=1 Tax=Blyttiomyces helicus TaxID=388810 RepID=A0A4P9VV87_9FUNG|nr:hypothetical protein BDK51DRAFT_49866 [Blyttiomyces helicus]|eukprot:RKO83544.1 hypothetical protein BDK51DRAFT_49866 [Blyttiomyces helicus]